MAEYPQVLSVSDPMVLDSSIEGMCDIDFRTHFVGSQYDCRCMKFDTFLRSKWAPRYCCGLDEKAYRLRIDTRAWNVRKPSGNGREVAVLPVDFIYVQAMNLRNTGSSLVTSPLLLNQDYEVEMDGFFYRIKYIGDPFPGFELKEPSPRPGVVETSVSIDELYGLLIASQEKRLRPPHNRPQGRMCHVAPDKARPGIRIYHDDSTVSYGLVKSSTMKFDFDRSWWRDREPNLPNLVLSLEFDDLARLVAGNGIVGGVSRDWLPVRVSIEYNTIYIAVDAPGLGTPSAGCRLQKTEILVH